MRRVRLVIVPRCINFYKPKTYEKRRVMVTIMIILVAERLLSTLTKGDLKKNTRDTVLSF